MEVSVGDRWGAYLEQLVRDGRYPSVDAVIDDAMTLVADREAKFDALRSTLAASVERGGENSMDDVRAGVKATLDQVEQAKRAA